MAPSRNPEKVKVHDYKDPELGKVNLYGVYDLATNSGSVSVGTDTAYAQQWHTGSDAATGPRRDAAAARLYTDRARRWAAGAAERGETSTATTRLPAPAMLAQWRRHTGRPTTPSVSPMRRCVSIARTTQSVRRCARGTASATPASDRAAPGAPRPPSRSPGSVVDRLASGGFGCVPVPHRVFRGRVVGEPTRPPGMPKSAIVGTSAGVPSSRW
jgi:Rhodopirellula transposase DDE domain